MTRRRPSREPLYALALLLIAVPTTACGAVEDQLNDAATDALDAAIEQEADRRLADAGVELATPVDCTTDGDLSLGSLSGDIVTSCSATTTDDLPATATFDGVVSADGCDGVLTVVVDGRQVYDGAVSGPECSL